MDGCVEFRSVASRRVCIVPIVASRRHACERTGASRLKWNDFAGREKPYPFEGLDRGGLVSIGRTAVRGRAGFERLR